MTIPAISSHADHNPDHLRFQRQHTGEAPEPIQPMRPIIHDVISAVGLVLFMIAAFLASDGAPGLMKWMGL